MSAADREALSEYAELRLKPHEDRRLNQGHLWVFSNEVDTDATPLTSFEPGALAQLRSSRDRFLGYVYVNPHSLISARILARNLEDRPGPELFERRLKDALSLRERTHGAPYYRLVYGESDLLPGLIIDRYGDICAIQIATAGMEAQRSAVLEALERVLHPSGVLLKNDSGARDLEGLPHYVEVAAGTVPEQVEVVEAGLSFRVPLAGGQKTGWYYDQTFNRAQFLPLARGARRVLDVCGYAGAWGIRAALANQGHATVVDASAGALAVAAANAERLGVALTTVKGDAFDVLARLKEERAEFDLVVLDPPAFVKRRREAARGEAAYRRLNQLAMQVMAPDALLATCSCSYHLDLAAFTGAVHSAARHLGREAQIIATGGQSPDHPVHAAIPETRYLKALLLRLAVP